jgi:hypothetical protein
MDDVLMYSSLFSVKNSRLLAEFREIDSYLTGSEDEAQDDSESDGQQQPTLAQAEFDNSVLRMGRSLLAAAKANPIQGTNEIPQVTLRLTRLDISPVGPDGEANDPRIAKTVQCLRDMGVDVQLGERDTLDVPLPRPQTTSPRLEPTIRINLDLSVLIALVSDLTRSPLPGTIEEASVRFIPPQKYREWKKQRMAGHVTKKQPSAAVDDVSARFLGELSKHSKALTHHVLQEMRKGLIQELFDTLSTIPSIDYRAESLAATTDGQCSTLFPKIEFWTTPEARSRCLRIIAKIGGENEKRRAHALFPLTSTPFDPASIQVLEEAYWRDSRYPKNFIPLMPIRLHPSSEPPLPGPAPNPTNLPSFFKSLSQTCRDILAEEVVPDPRMLRNDLVEEQARVGDSSECDVEGGEIQRATVVKANPRLTSHTVQTLLWGAELGWTTLTANKSGVKAILRELKAARMSGKVTYEPEAVGMYERDVCEKAAIWIVDPRSLAEGMRSDNDSAD